MRRLTALVAALSGSLAAMSPAAASAPKTLRFLVCQVGGPELEPKEQTIIRDFYGYVGGQLGFGGGHVEGDYLTRRTACVGALKNNPAVLMLSLDLFLEQKEALDLVPVAQVSMDGSTTSRFHLMVAADGPKTLADLRGKSIAGTQLDDARFVARLLLGGKLGPAKELVLVPHKLGLRAVRAVIRGKASAVLLDDAQYNAIADTPFASKLRRLHSSEPLPNPPVAVARKRSSPDLTKRLGKALIDMENNERGRVLIKTFGIRGFVAPAAGAWDALEKRMKAP